MNWSVQFTIRILMKFNRRLKVVNSLAGYLLGRGTQFLPSTAAGHLVSCNWPWYSAGGRPLCLQFQLLEHGQFSQCLMPTLSDSLRRVCPSQSHPNVVLWQQSCPILYNFFPIFSPSSFVFPFSIRSLGHVRM